jgi:hypothetical protein
VFFRQKAHIQYMGLQKKGRATTMPLHSVWMWGLFCFGTARRGILPQQWLYGFFGAVRTRPKHPLVRHGPVKALIIARTGLVHETPSVLFSGRVGLSFHKNTLFPCF